MGNVWGGPSTPAPAGETPPFFHGRKRGRGGGEGEEEEVEELSPRRKRRQSTSTYIYETLFKGGANSDVTIVALGE